MVVRPLKNNTFEVVESFTFLHVNVPKGYETNGADIPRVLWSFYPPFKPKYLQAIVLHDYLCEFGKDLKEADEKLKEGLETLGANKFTCKIFYFACRAYHIAGEILCGRG